MPDDEMPKEQRAAFFTAHDSAYIIIAIREFIKYLKKTGRAGMADEYHAVLTRFVEALLADSRPQ